MSTMSGRHVGPIRAIWNFLRRQRVLTRESKEDCVGIDKKGNKYYLRHANQEFNIRESRYVIPPEQGQDTDMIPLAKNVPPEWDAWLRGRRPHPPTAEELQRIELEKLKRQQRVKELEKKERMELGEATDADEGLEPTDSTKDGVTKTIEGDTRKKAFPTYDDFEIHPGEFVGDKQKH